MTRRVVLYIEDDPGNARLVGRVLKRLPGVDVLVAGTGRDGVQTAVDDRPDLILLDNHLPDAGGGQILGWLRAAPHTAAIPVVMVSGDSGGLAADELLALGAADVLTKPVDIHLLLATVGRYLSAV
jgi:CheY-like chemotaxis protein